MSDSTTAVITAIRTRLLNFAPTTGTKLSTSLGTRLYRNTAPTVVTYPYGVLRLQPMAGNDDSGLEKRASLELALFHRPTGNTSALTGIADVAEQALWQWLRIEDASGPFIKFYGRAHAVPVPYSGEAVDTDLVHYVLTFPLWYRPAYLHQYAT